MPAMIPGEGDEEEILIEPGARGLFPDFRELWRRRDLLLLLIRRDLASRYRQSLIGVGWALLRPVLSTLVFVLVFGRVAGLPSEGAPYALFVYAGLIPWTLFAECLTRVSSAVTAAAPLVGKVHFPRLVLPLSGVGTAAADCAVQLLLLVPLMIWYETPPGPAAFAVLGFLAMGAASATAFGLWVTALNVRWRDFGHLVPFAVQMWMWITPIVYPASLIPEEWRPVYALNPMVGVVEGFRWALLGLPAPDWGVTAVSAGATLLVLIGGLIFFHRTERRFADVI